jgi:hypothetical protein
VAPLSPLELDIIENADWTSARFFWSFKPAQDLSAARPKFDQADQADLRHGTSIETRPL